MKTEINSVIWICRSAAVENGRSNEYNPYDHRVVEHPNT